MNFLTSFYGKFGEANYDAAGGYYEVYMKNDEVDATYRLKFMEKRLFAIGVVTPFSTKYGEKYVQYNTLCHYGTTVVVPPETFQTWGE